MIDIGICDNSYFCKRYLKELLLKLAIIIDVELNVTYFDDAAEVLTFYENQNQLHLLFIENDLGSSNGIDLARYIRKHYCPLLYIIFISSASLDNSDVIEVKPFRLLRKPISSKVLYQTMFRLLEDIYKRQHKYLTVKDYQSNENVVIPYADIIYVEHLDSAKQLLAIRTSNKKIQTKKRLKAAYEELKPFAFVYTHRCSIVSLTKIEAFNTDTLTVSTGDNLPLSRKHKMELFDIYGTRLIDIYPNIEDSGSNI